MTSLDLLNIGAMGLNHVWNVDTVKRFSVISIVRIGLPMDHFSSKEVVQNHITFMDRNLTDGSKMRDSYS
jgi:hypothetical protein